MRVLKTKVVQLRQPTAVAGYGDGSEPLEFAFKAGVVVLLPNVYLVRRAVRCSGGNHGLTTAGICLPSASHDELQRRRGESQGQGGCCCCAVMTADDSADDSAESGACVGKCL